VLALSKLSMVNRCTLNVINRTGLSHNCLIVFAAMYPILTVACSCYHCDRAVTYVLGAIISIVQTYALTCSVWKKIAMTLCIRKTCVVSGRKNDLTLLVHVGI